MPSGAPTREREHAVAVVVVREHRELLCLPTNHDG